MHVRRKPRKEENDEAVMLCIVLVRTLVCVCKRSISAHCCHVRMDRNVFFIWNFVRAGTTVIVEKALASILLEEFKESHCHHCLHWTPGPVPCHQCSQVSLSIFWHLVSHLSFKKRLFNREILFGGMSTKDYFCRCVSVCGYSCVKSR